jgi:thiosulfate/3-mercaptopyruvate sulfurtransferase
MSSSSSSTTAAPINEGSNNNSGLVTIHEALAAYHHGTNSHGGKNIYIDGSWHMPTSSRNARLEYIQGPRIPGALYFDIDDISSPSTTNINLPHMKPTSRLFAYVMDIMDICPQDTIYIYATAGCAFVHRTYWTFAYTGYHDPKKVKLIQGSLDEWKQCNGPIDHEEIIINSSHDNDDDAVIVDKRLFHVNELDTSISPKYIPWKDDDDGRSVSDRSDVLAVVLDKQRSTKNVDNDNNNNKSSSATIIVDARSSGRFYGTEPEPRPGLRGGHIPGSINVPFITLLNPYDVTKFRPIMEVRSILIDAGIHEVEENNTMANKVDMKVICSCGSGVTAATLAVALVESGLRNREDVSIYDGSWIDWGGSDDTPIETD